MNLQSVHLLNYQMTVIEDSLMTKLMLLTHLMMKAHYQFLLLAFLMIRVHFLVISYKYLQKQIDFQDNLKP